MELDEAFGLALRETRRRANLVQEDFDSVASREWMSLLERGQRSPRLGQIDAIANRIGVHPLTLLTKCYLTRSPETELDDVLNRIANEMKILEGTTSNPFI